MICTAPYPMNIIMNSLTVSHVSELAPYEFRAVFYVAIAAVSLASIIGNVLVIFTILRTQNLRTSTNYYITSMAISDVFFVASSWELYATSRHALFELPLPTFLCKLCTYLAYVSYSVSTSSLVLISVDRFLAIVFPLRVSMMTPGVRAVFILLYRGLYQWQSFFHISIFQGKQNKLKDHFSHLHALLT